MTTVGGRSYPSPTGRRAGMRGEEQRLRINQEARNDKHPGSNLKLQTSNLKPQRETRNEKRETRNEKRETRNQKHQTPHSTFVIFTTFVGRCKCTGVLPVFTITSPVFTKPLSFKMSIWSFTMSSRLFSSS
jgi:hypothetical protein